jgi:hypothetical protein
MGIYDPYRTWEKGVARWADFCLRFAPAQAYRRRKSAFLLGDRIWIITQQLWCWPSNPSQRAPNTKSFGDNPFSDSDSMLTAGWVFYLLLNKFEVLLKNKFQVHNVGRKRLDLFLFQMKSFVNSYSIWCGMTVLIHGRYE